MDKPPDEQELRELPWATLDDQLDALDQVRAHGTAWAKIVDVDGDLRLKCIGRPAPIATPRQRFG